MPFKKKGFSQNHSVNLRTEKCILFFEETCFFCVDNSLSNKKNMYSKNWIKTDTKKLEKNIWIIKFKTVLYGCTTLRKRKKCNKTKSLK